MNRGKEEARLMQTKWRINEPITTATPAPAQPPPAPESQARPSELQGHPPENSVTSVTTLGERGTEDQSPDAEQLQENSNNDVEKSAAVCRLIYPVVNMFSNTSSSVLAGTNHAIVLSRPASEERCAKSVGSRSKRCRTRRSSGLGWNPRRLLLQTLLQTPRLLAGVATV